MNTKDFTQALAKLTGDAVGTGLIRNILIIYDTGKLEDGTQSLSSFRVPEDQARYAIYFSKLKNLADRSTYLDGVEVKSE